jgi:hypothetical protein
VPDTGAAPRVYPSALRCRSMAIAPGVPAPLFELPTPAVSVQPRVKMRGRPGKGRFPAARWSEGRWSAPQEPALPGRQHRPDDASTRTDPGVSLPSLKLTMTSRAVALEVADHDVVGRGVSGHGVGLLHRESSVRHPPRIRISPSSARRRCRTLVAVESPRRPDSKTRLYSPLWSL